MRALTPLLVIGAIASTAPPATAATLSGPAEIVDADTIDIGAARIRIHGIDAPEAGQKCERQGGNPWSCDEAARGALAELIGASDVSCEIRQRDTYGRLISVCTADGTDLGAALVARGLAWAYVDYSRDYVPDEAAARERGLGIWQDKSDPTPPWEYRADRWERAAAAAPREGCPIKGNIAQDGERIYHTPWSPWYGRTQINEAKGERWFCDENEAIDSGWRPARFN